jgi:hypothetical protein
MQLCVICETYHQDTPWLIIIVSLCVVEVYQICIAYFSQVMHFIVTWLCAVRRGKGTGHPTPFNSCLSTPRSGGMGCAVRGHVCMQVCVCACVCMRIWCRHCLRMQPAFGLMTVHTYIHTYIHTKERNIHLGFGVIATIWKIFGVDIINLPKILYLCMLTINHGNEGELWAYIWQIQCSGDLT